MPREILRGSTHMGRGRAKAKQTKVARDLKYRAVDTDFASLERELRSTQDADPYDSRAMFGEDDIPEQYADVAARYDSAGIGFDEDDVETGLGDEDDRR